MLTIFLVVNLAGRAVKKKNPPIIHQETGKKTKQNKRKLPDGPCGFIFNKRHGCLTFHHWIYKNRRQQQQHNQHNWPIFARQGKAPVLEVSRRCCWSSGVGTGGGVGQRPCLWAKEDMLGWRCWQETVLFKPPTGCLKWSPGCQEVQRKKKEEEWNQKWPGFNIMWRKWCWLNLWLGRMSNTLFCEEPIIVLFLFFLNKHFGAAGAVSRDDMRSADLKCQTNKAAKFQLGNWFCCSPDWQVLIWQETGAGNVSQ